MKSYGPVQLSKKLEQDFYNVDVPEDGEVFLGDITSDDPGLKKLVKEFGGDYPISDLLEANGTKLSTHMRADEIKLNWKFQIEGPDGDGGAGVRKQFRRVENPFGPNVVNKQIAAKVTYAFDDTRNTTVRIAANRLVRPVIEGDSHDNYICGIFHTPEELAEQKQVEKDSSKAYDAIHDKVEAYIKKTGKRKVFVLYSAYSTDKHGVPINNLDKIAVKGKCQFVEGKYKSPVMENPTWLQMTALANEMIKKTKDTHHCYLEGVRRTKKKTDGIAVYNFSMGS